MKRRILSALLVLVMLFSVLPVSSLAAGDGDGIKPIIAGKSGLSIPAKTISFENDKVVQVIVELNTQPLGIAAAQFSEVGAATFGISAAALMQRSIVMEQDAVFSSLERKYDLGEMDHRFTAVMNGFSTEVAASDIDALKADKNVKNVYIVQEYELPKTPDGDIYSNMMIGSDIVNSVGLDGEGMLIAIVDTGLDYNHELFTALDADVDEPKIADKAAMDTIINSAGLNAVNGRYISSKVVFGYDYADGDGDPMDTVGHGTHVAGIAAANSTPEGIVIGVAPNAQLMTMKVFNDSGYTSDIFILSALDDAVKLGADAVNISIGSPCGFTEPYDTGYFLDYGVIYAAALGAGTFLSLSAGNEGTMGPENFQAMYYGIDAPYPYASNPDYGLVGATGTYAGAISTASADNIAMVMPAFEATPKGGNPMHILYSDTNVTAFADTFSGRTLEYVAVPGYGAPPDFNGLNLTGKVALISRGAGINFAVKAANAAARGAIAAVIYNDADDGYINMALDESPIPAIFILREEGETLAAAGTGTMTFARGNSGSIPNATGGLISDFSSRGVTPDLKIKPEIAAPGGTIYSTLPASVGSYGAMSGTSMASPHVAGAGALVKQYITEAYPEYGIDEQVELIQQLLMSAALPTGYYDSDGNPVYYSVNAQGAGMLDVVGALLTPAVLIGEGGMSKAELGDKLDYSSIEVPFTVKNITGDEVTFDLSGVLYTDNWLDASFLQVAYIDPDATVTLDDAPVFSGVGVDGATVTVGAYGEVEVVATFSILKGDHDYLMSVFTNGYFADGYVFATPEGGYYENGYDLSIPFLGFVGDWTLAPAIDSSNIYDTYWDEDTYWTDEPSFDTFYGFNAAYGHNEDFISSEDLWDLLGFNEALAFTSGYEWTDGIAPKSTIAFSPGDNSYGYTEFAPLVALLRNLRSVRAEVTDANGNVVRSLTTDDEFFIKSLFYSNAAEIIMLGMMEIGLEWDGKNDDGVYVAEGVYTYTIYGTLDYPGADDTLQTWSIDVAVDQTAPTYSTVLNELYNTVTITASDELMKSITFRDGTNELAHDIIDPIGYIEGGEYVITLDLTPILDDYDSFADAVESIYVRVDDYAGNFTQGTIAAKMGQPQIVDYYVLQTVFAPGPLDTPIDVYVNAINTLSAPVNARFDVYDDPWGMGLAWDTYFIERGWEGIYDDSLLEEHGDNTGSKYLPEYQFASILSANVHVQGHGMYKIKFPLTWNKGFHGEYIYTNSEWMPDYFYWEKISEAYDIVYEGFGMPIEAGTNYRMVLQVQGHANTAVYIPITITNLPFISEAMNQYNLSGSDDLSFTIGFGVNDDATGFTSITLGSDELIEGTDYVLNGNTLTVFRDALDAHLEAEGDTVTLTAIFNDEAATVATSVIKAYELYTVTFDSQGGTNVAPVTGLRHGAKIAAPVAAMERYNSVFNGWFKDIECTELWDFQNDTVTENTTLYAGWTQYYDVTFDADNGDEPVTVTVRESARLTEPDAPVNGNFPFAGWFLGGELYDFSAPVTSDMTLVAKWIASVTPSASVAKLNGNQNRLYITVKVTYTDGSSISITWDGLISNNAAGTYTVGGYNVYVDTKGNTQIRACYIVK